RGSSITIKGRSVGWRRSIGKRSITPRRSPAPKEQPPKGSLLQQTRNVENSRAARIGTGPSGPVRPSSHNTLTALDRQQLAHMENTAEGSTVKLDADLNLAGLGRGHSHGGPAERASGET